MRAPTLAFAALAAGLLLLAPHDAPAGNHLLSLLTGGGEKGSGKLETRDIATGTFDSVVLDGSVDVFVAVGGTLSVKATLDDNLFDNFEAKVEDGALHLDWKEDCRPARKSRVDISVPDLRGFTVNGAGDVDISGVRGGELELRIHGAGDMTVAGKADAVEIAVSGAGDVDAADLIAKAVTVKVSGAGDANVHAVDSLHASVSGVGDIEYTGDPQEKTTRVSGVGSIHHR
jgi:hypothetical protein